jgi:tetratricopeptide (TPR) repeat protein
VSVRCFKEGISRVAFESEGLIRLAKARCRNGDDFPESLAVISELAILLANITPGENDVSRDAWGDLICFQAKLLRKTGQGVASLALLEPLVQPTGLLSDFVSAHRSYAKILATLGQTERAVQHLAPLLQPGGLVDGSAHCHVNYATYLFKLGRAGMAAWHLRRVADAVHPLSGNKYIQVTYASALVRHGDGAAAVSYLEPLMQDGTKLSKDSYAQTTYAAALALDGQPDRAIAYLSELVQDGGALAQQVVALTHYAVLLVDHQRPVAAAEFLRPRLEQGGPLYGDSVATYIMCKALYFQGKKGEAIDYGLSYIDKTQGRTKQAHITGVAILLAIFSEEAPEIGQLKDDLYRQKGPEALVQAKSMAGRWRQKDLAVTMATGQGGAMRGASSLGRIDATCVPISRDTRRGTGLYRTPLPA